MSGKPIVNRRNSNACRALLFIPCVTSDAVQESWDPVLYDATHRCGSLGDVSQISGKRKRRSSMTVPSSASRASRTRAGSTDSETDSPDVAIGSELLVMSVFYQFR